MHLHMHMHSIICKQGLQLLMPQATAALPAQKGTVISCLRGMPLLLQPFERKMLVLIRIAATRPCVVQSAEPSAKQSVPAWQALTHL